MNTVKNPSKRLARWIDEFQAYDLDIRYWKGSKAIVPYARSRGPDFLNAILQYDECSQHIETYLVDKILPEDSTLRTKVLQDADLFALDETGVLVKKLKYVATLAAPYINPLFHGDFMKRMHLQFGRLSYARMSNAVEMWGCGMDTDICQFIAGCLNCQVVQGSRNGQEKEYAQLVTDQFIAMVNRSGCRSDENFTWESVDH